VSQSIEYEVFRCVRLTAILNPRFLHRNETRDQKFMCGGEVIKQGRSLYKQTGEIEEKRETDKTYQPALI
jgi:hypothetical protein